MPNRNISDIPTVTTYAKSTNAILDITSVASKLSVKFPAFLTDFSQTFDAQWNTEDVFGRADPIATYQGTKRTMSLGFDVIAGSEKGAKSNLGQCRDLVKMVYPVYKKGVLSKPPLVRIRFANLIVGAQKDPGSKTDAQTVVTETKANVQEVQEELSERIKQNKGDEVFKYNAGGVNVQGETKITEQIAGTKTPPVNKSYVGLLGWISGLSWKPNLEMGMFATGKNFYPKVIPISFTFNVLHEHVPSQSGKAASFPFRTS